MKDNTMEALPMVEKPGLGSWLFNPFAYVAGVRSLLIGVAVILASGILAAMSNSRFDGVLDFHIDSPGLDWWFALEGLVNLFSLVLPLWIAGRLISPSKFRVIDLLGTQALARAPMILSSIVALLPPFQNFSNYLVNKLTKKVPEVAFQPVDALIFFVGMVAILVSVFWMVWLMYSSFRISCNVKGPKAVVAFVASLFVAEILSKLIGVFLMWDWIQSLKGIF